MTIRTLFGAILLLAAAHFSAGAQEPAVDPSDNPARQRLQDSVEFIAAQPAFSVDFTMALHFETKGGERDGVTLSGQLALAGSDQGRFRLETDQGAMELFLNADAKVVYLAQENQYVDGSTFGDRQKALTIMPGGSFRAAQILFSDFLHNDPRLLQAAGEVTFGPAPDGESATADLLRVQGEGLVTDFWVEKGDKPLLQKFALDITQMVAEANPDVASATITYTFTNWNLAPEFPESHFAFTVPEGATEFRNERPKDPMEGKPAPNITLRLLGSEGSLDLASHKGKNVVILDFWASWCGPCRVGLPIVTEVAEQFKDRNVVMYAVNAAEDPKVAQAFVERVGLTATVALDSEMDAMRKFNADKLPKTVIIDKNGIIHEVHLGVTPGLKSELTETLTRLTE